MDKIPFNDAARQAGIHLNTLRNWQKSGKLKTAEKVVENGRELWIVDPSELDNISSQHGKKPDNNNVDTIDINNGTTELPDPPGQASSPAFEQSLALIRESVVRPLTELVERQTSQIAELSLEVGELRAELRLLKEAAVVTQASPVAQPAPIPVQPVEITPRAPDLPQAAQEPPRRGWWSRLFGGV